MLNVIKGERGYVSNNGELQNRTQSPPKIIIYSMSIYDLKYTNAHSHMSKAN